METRKLHKDDVVTGVLQNNRCSYLFEDADLYGIDPHYDEALEEYRKENPDDEYGDGFCYEGGDTIYVGVTQDEKTKLYDPDPDAEYTAVINSNYGTTQVVASKYAIECHRCSPCYPNQGDIDTPGNSYIAFCLPPDMWDDSDGFDKSRIFKIEWEA